MKKPIYPLLVILLFAPCISTAQILNVDRNQILTDTAKFVTGSIAFKFHLDNKNASTEQKNSYISLENKNDLVFVGLKNNYMILSQIKYFNSTGGTFISTGYAHTRANFMKMNKISVEIFSQIQYDRNRFMNNRFLFGGGLRWRLTNTAKSGIFLGTELMYEHEKWDNPEEDNTFIKKDLPKFSGYLSMRISANKISTFRSVIYYQTGYDPEPGIMRNRFSYDLQFEIEMSRKLLFTVKFTGAYEDHPIYPINKFIYAIENGLVWAF
jgi:hypothetical protein